MSDLVSETPDWKSGVNETRSGLNPVSKSTPMIRRVGEVVKVRTFRTLVSYFVLLHGAADYYYYIRLLGA